MTEHSPLPSDATRERLVMIQADLDDETPERLGALLEEAIAAGARDATCTPLLMKKGRPGHRVEILTREEEAERFEAFLLLGTRTLGVRRVIAERTALARRVERVAVRGEEIRVKVALWNGRAVRAKPEFEDCRRAAKELHVPFADFHAEAQTAANRLLETR